MLHDCAPRLMIVLNAVFYTMLSASCVAGHEVIGGVGRRGLRGGRCVGAHGPHLPCSSQVRP